MKVRLPSPGWPGQPRRQLAEQSAVRPAWLYTRNNYIVSGMKRLHPELRFTFNGMRELWAKGDVGDRNVIKDKVEPPSTLHQVLSNQSRHLSE